MPRARARSLKPIAIACLVVLGVALLALAFGVKPLPDNSQRRYETALPAGTSTRLDRYFAPTIEEHPHESGFRLVADGVEAFALRALTAQHAERSLDVQYYIWNSDVTGVLLIRELLNAADRGVHVRLLLDDLDARAKNFALTAIDAHPNIEVRIFNPFASRSGFAGKVIEALASFSRINGRMHNKAWIADNRIAIAGGRNVGDEYFTASGRLNFLDLDFAILGPAVGEMSGAFDSYWNSAAVWPIAALNPESVDPARLAALRVSAQERFAHAEHSTYGRALASNGVLQSVAADPGDIHWSSRWQVLTDDPLKAQLEHVPLSRSAVLRGLSGAIERAHHEVELISAYFVPGEHGTAVLTGLARAGAEVSILTNSLAATDVAAAHAGYANYREALIAGGASLWELKPDPLAGSHGLSTFGSSGASLHTKAVMVDRQLLFVGSFNLDPRSVSLNCEQGVLVDDPELANQSVQLLERVRASAWRVSHGSDGRLEWTDGHQTLEREPGASLSRRTFARVLRWLPIESQL
jgi:putative cardiolipin synthase